VAIYNVAGQMVTQYNGTSEAGVVNVVWDGKDNSGSTVASGIYFYKAAAANFSATKKMVLMK
jgi:flagellar hook assembly protein FlgD